MRVVPVFVVSWRGPELALVDDVLLSAPTRRLPPADHVLEELQIAYRAGLARRK